MAEEPKNPWLEIEAMPEFQAKTPMEKWGYAEKYLDRMSQYMAPDLADNPEAQQKFRDRSKQFLVSVAEKHFPNALESMPSQFRKSLATADGALALEGSRMNTEIGQQAADTLAKLAETPDDAIVPGDPTVFRTMAPERDMPAGEYRTYLQSVVDAQAEKGLAKNEKVLKSFADAAKETPSSTMLQWQLSDGVGDFIQENWSREDNAAGKVTDFVGSLAGLVVGANVESSVQSLPAIVPGAAATLASGGNPVVGGAVMGAIAGNTEFQATYLGELQEELQKRGDISSKGIQEILADPEWNARVDEKAKTRGVTIGTTEGVAGTLSFGIAKAIGTDTLKRTLLSGAAGMGTDAAGGSGGEFLARLFSGDDIWTPEAQKDIQIEGISEIGSGITGTAVELIQNRGRKPATPTTNEENVQQTAPETGQASQPETPQAQVNEPAPEPEIDDRPVRSVVEEFASEEADAEVAPVETAAPSEVGTETVIPPSPVDEISPVDEPAPAQTPAPLETPAIADEEVNTPDAVDTEPIGGAMEPVQTFDVADNLTVNIYQNEDGTARVEKVNSETGATIPLDGAEQAFPSRADAFAFIRDRFRSDEYGEILAEPTPEIDAFEETDPLMLFLQAEKMQPVQDNIREIGNVSRRKQKGFRALDKDAANRGDYDGVPLLSEYRGVAQERLRSIYQRGSNTRPDQAAQRAFDAGLISDPSASALFQAIRDRLEKVGGESQITSSAQAEAAAIENDTNRERDYLNFQRVLKSPYRSGGLIEAGALQVGDVLEVAGDRVRVTAKDEEGVEVFSQKYGGIQLANDERVGYDAFDENGIPMSERENIAPEDRVTREEAAERTTFLQEKLGDPSIVAVPSREHSALAKNRAELEAARRLARLFNRRVVGVQNFPANGAVSRADNANIYIATDSSRTELLIVAHELLHQMRQAEPDLYQDLLDTLDADLAAYIADARGEHSDKSIDMLQEEFLADYLSDKSADPAFWESLAVRSPDLFERFVAFIRQFLNDLRDRIMGERIGVERYLRDAAAMQRTMEDVLIAFKARQSQDRKGILDVPLDESMPFADVRFADERRRDQIQEFSQIIQGDFEGAPGTNEALAAVAEKYFDSAKQISYWSIEEAHMLISEIEQGLIDAIAETGMTQANQALTVHLYTFANRVLREEGDASLMNRMRGRTNSWFNGEISDAARKMVTRRAWAQTPMEGTLGQVEEAKKAAVEKIAPGAGVVDDIEKIQRDADAIVIKPEDFTAGEDAAVLESIKGRRQTSAPSAPGTAGEIALAAGRKKVGRNLRAVAAKLDALLNADNDILFADARVNDGNRRTLVQQLIADQAKTGRRKRGAFIKVAMELGLTEEVAANRFDRIAEIRAEAKAARELDAKEAAQEKAEPTAEEKLLAELDEEAARLDRLNDKATKISERLTAGPKKRAKPDPAKKAPLDNLVADAIENGTSREEIIKQGLRAGLKQEAAARLADAIAIEQQRRAGRRKKGEKKSIDARARDLAKRFDNPQDRPARQRDELRVLINETLRENSTVTEQGFMDRMRGLGASKADSSDLWASVSRERVKRQGIRDLKRQAAREKAAQEASQNEAETIIKRLAASQSDTQDNRTRKRQESIVRELYRDAIGYGPVRSRQRFVTELEAAGVDSNTANRLFDLALRERQNRTEVAKASDANRIFGRPGLPATDRTYPAMKAEILAHPQLRLVGPEERLNIMAGIFRDRAGLADVDARAAAVKFDAQLVAKWEEATLRLAEETATKRNAPWFRRTPGELIAVSRANALIDQLPRENRKKLKAEFQKFLNSTTLEAKDLQATAESMGVSTEIAKKIANYGIEARAKQSRKRMDFIDRVRQAIRSGAMDPRKRLLDEVAKSNGWMDLTDVELQRLSELDAALSSPGITTLEKMRAQRQMLDVINGSALPLTVTGVLKDMYIANSFSSLSTMLIGSLSGAFEGLAALPRDAFLSVIRVSEARNPTGFVTALGQIPRYIAAAFTDAAVTFRTGDTRLELAEEFKNATANLDRVWAKYSDRLTSAKSTKAQKTGALVVLIGALGRFALRVLATFDSLSRGYINRYTTEMEAFSRAAGLGMKRREILAMLGTVQQNAEMFKEDAIAKGFTKKSDILAYVQDRTAMAIYAALEGKGIDMKAIKERAAKEANLTTGMGEIERGWLGVGQIAQSTKEWSRGDTFGALLFKVVIPVVTTPYNYFHRGLWFTPYALPRIIATAKQTSGFTNWSKSNYQNSLASPTQLAMRSAEALIGNLIFAGLAKVFFDQLDEEDEEKKWLRINLAGPSKTERARHGAWLEDGNRPFTLQLKVGGEWITYGFRRGGLEIFNPPLTMLGAVQQARINGEPYWKTLSKELMGEAFFFMRGPMSRGHSIDSLGGELGYRASGFVPISALLKTPNRFEDMKDKPSGFWDNFKMQMPIVPQMSDGRPALNSLGQPVGFNETSGSYIQSKLNIPLGSVPVASRNRTASNPGYNDVLILLNDKRTFPTQYAKSDLDESLKRASTDDEFYEFTKVRGELILQKIKANYVELWTLEPAAMKKAITKFTEDANDAAKRVIRAKAATVSP